ncbi:MAG: coproporphyrinogen dehydrogenase HemZ [Lachnospiraceae bacterium]|nr:coproporphyrinogen dehydrogenase HemZ [Lachnospiraceae bacterium]
MKIGFVLERDEFEYDIRGLLMAFYPGAEIVQNPAEGEELDSFLFVPASHREARIDRKNEVKQWAYHELVSRTGHDLPWGALTGIRPTKIAMALLEEGRSPQEAEEVMRREYLVSEQKSALAVQIAGTERELLRNIDYEDGYSLYIGIPFCPTTCLYCSFTSYPMDKWAPRMGEYLDALEREIDYTAETFRGKKLNTLYIGGGTPTSLSPELLDRLLKKLGDIFDYSYLQEFTVEGGRPDSITPEKLAVLRRYPVTRISINPQTMKEETLQRIGRRHTVEDVRRAYAMAREAGFDNINMDIILGLPGEKPSDVAETVAEITKLAPDSLTVHALAIKRASRLKMEAHGTVLAGGTQEESEEMMDIASRGAAAMGMEPYYLYRQKNMAGNLENVGYARPGKAGLYNILIMEEKQTIVALGAGTVTKGVFPDGRIERVENVKAIDQYLTRIDEMIERKRGLFSV